MRDAETVLTIIRERGRQGLPLEDIYRMLYNKTLYLRAYAQLYDNDGAVTQGTTQETVDGMSLAKINRIIEDLKYERYRWTPVRRTHIPKPNGKMRPLGIPTWSDKLLQEVIRSILEAYYEPQFNDHSHGFRPNRGCHTALREIQTKWTGTRWFIEGDIAKCFDTIDHQVLLEILGEKLHDNRFLLLLKNLFQAGYLEDWEYNQTLSGTPQGAIVSPILSNIYLDRFDQHIENVLIPTYTRGEERKENPEYERIRKQIIRKRKQGNQEAVHELWKQLQQLPSKDPQDPDYRRLKYARYADDFLLGFSGSRREAEEIKHLLSEFLSNRLKLELSKEKTLITQASEEPAKFLGYEIVNQQANDKHDQSGRRSANGRIGLRVPVEVIAKAQLRYMNEGGPVHRPELAHDDDFSIIVRYQQEYRGLVQYYALAQNICWLQKLHWTMETSLLKTLANKHRTTVSKVAQKYRTHIHTPQGETLKCLEKRIERDGKPPLIARFGGIPLKRQPFAALDERPYVDKGGRTEILQRLLADECELCGSTEEVEVHHVRSLKDLSRKGRVEKPEWTKQMIARRRKTLMVCRQCHLKIHNGKATPNQPDTNSRSSHRRAGCVEKRPSGSAGG